MSTSNAPVMQRAQIVYGEIIYWMTVVACLICMVGPVISVAFPDNNVLNPYYLFNSIFEGKSPIEVWQSGGEQFPGGHFYLKNLTKGDGFTQLGLAIGCSSAIWGLLGAAFVYFRERVYIYVVLSLWVAALVTLSMIGIVGGSH